MCWLKSTRGGGACSIDVSQSIHSRFFKSISILISVFAFAVAGAACGGSEKKDKPSDADAGIIEDAGVDQCEAGHFGANCDPCTCEHGTCNDGRDGDGKCSACDEGYWGENCASKTVTCIAGTPSLGVTGDGTCISCHANTGWSGENCDVCEGNYWGPSCNQVPTCTEHGTPSLGIEGTGLCTECEEGWDLDKNCAELLDNYMLDKAGNVYKTTKIGDQVWMAKNMAWQDESVTCHANTEADADFIANFGCLYTWEDANKVCPDGWHLPDKEEFEALLDYVEKNRTASSNMAALMYKADPGVFTYDEFGFSALLAGGYINGSYAQFNERANFWSATELTNNSFAYLLAIGTNMNTLGTALNSNAKENAFSVRCLKTEMKCQHGTPDAATGHCQDNTCEAGYIGKDCDIENKCGHGTLDSATGHCQAGSCEAGFDGVDCDISVTNIGGQIWMTKNMDVTTGRDGSTLTCYANTEADPDFVAHYGCLYPWDDAMKACPAGWHLPTFEEFDALLTYVDAHRTSSSVFLALIPASTYWVDFQGQGGNEFGFSALPAGYYAGINTDHPFARLGDSAYFWSSTAECESETVPGFYGCIPLLYLSSGEADWDADSNDKRNGYPARCIKDAAVTE